MSQIDPASQSLQNQLGHLNQQLAEQFATMDPLNGEDQDQMLLLMRQVGATVWAHGTLFKTRNDMVQAILSEIR